MSSQIQMKPPLPVPVSASWSPSSKKENLDEAVPLDKRRRIVALGKMAGTTANPRMSRQVPSSVNTGPSPVDQAVVGTNAGSSAGVEFESREDMESLLNEKMKGKHKNDFKGS